MSERRLNREWDLPALLREFPEVQDDAVVLFRCKEPTTGRGRFRKEIPGGPQFADVVVEATPADGLCISLAHEWPAGVAAETTLALDRALLEGMLGAVADLGQLGLWGCCIKSTAVLLDERTAPISVKFAAALAVQDMIAKADWTPGPPTEPEAA